ncbi:glutamate formimidoyltransferase [candidate division WOR-1 bacterium RIFCSPHIGHO2_01_FULL_53_15]|uniref:glutamate formimidoyltransferase n=1 Tax=candidate division WOR-1 bacterium RIFCSPHIGHO2_01_FULL_53_15 TaxID=1802564 RepID=A0A1F4Q456_UNCSA|nr:MAG: glutamate formimidoyltransferase [candidate division WOR-1 bacterium RIFCSPHIGHO2_01_FULL_53_15]OGC13626.1 MAG: glutamate formimidoyltransferase [candidate division WOR-1 bacterium RIFCSPHIGHO2_02_FULL_53_26]
MTKIIECVPNFSEGRDETIIEEIVESVKTAKVVDLHSDPDHNRSVITMLGSPAGVRQAALDLTERAMQVLDINEHAGVHPFIGVVDVIPFIPVKNATMRDAIAVAHQVGNDLWEKFKLPAYFYGEAAKITERKDLPYVRKGGYLALKEESGDPRRKPDVGHGLHPRAGAAAVGARNFLIAYNIYLDTAEEDVAISIAKAIREKAGGLPGVRALGLFLESRGLSQVSINITDHLETSLKIVFDEVNSWAKEYKVKILESELVGLIPASAAFPKMKEYLKLRSLDKNQIIDNYL